MAGALRAASKEAWRFLAVETTGSGSLAERLCSTKSEADTPGGLTIRTGARQSQPAPSIEATIMILGSQASRNSLQTTRPGSGVRAAVRDGTGAQAAFWFVLSDNMAVCLAGFTPL